MVWYGIVECECENVGTGSSGHGSTILAGSWVSVTEPVSDPVFVDLYSKITRKDRARLHGDTVDQCMVAQALKKFI